ncbi:MAG: SoxR reducing system RseC family protein [Betaproteobacteria bacterium]|jgi:sigma-E factor negative regulatory protein RseC|nr:SoxR reducing system RseC family protein [Betaproteobacteria bacterium]
MMDQEAFVARVEGDHAYVEVGAAAGCGRCHETGGCQSGVLGQVFRTKPQRYCIANPIGAAPGDQVIVRVASGSTLRAAMLIYALPVLCLLLGAVAGSALGGVADNDAATALGALLGLAAGILSGIVVRQSAIGRVEDPVLIRHNSTYRISKETCR